MKLFYTTITLFVLLFSCSLQAAKVKGIDFYGEYRYVKHILMGESILYTKEEIDYMLKKGKVVIEKDYYYDGSSEKVKEIVNPRYEIKIITNSEWAMEPDPEDISYIYGYREERETTTLLKVYGKDGLYTRYEILDDKNLISFLSYQVMLLEKKE